MRRTFVAIGVLGIVAAAAFAARWPSGSPCTYGSLARGQLDLLAAKIESFALDTGRVPATLAELTDGNALGPYATPDELNDPWGVPFYYRAHADGRTFTLFTLGADGRVGGDGRSDADLQHAGE